MAFNVYLTCVVTLLLFFCSKANALALPDVCVSGDSRLVDGNNTRYGLLQVCTNNTWGTVCGDGFGVQEATVVCNQLGLAVPGGEIRALLGHFEGTGAILLDEVKCNGTESSLLNCSHGGLYMHDCSHNQDVGIACALPCTSVGEVRLVEANHEGRMGVVEVCVNGEWGPICEGLWDDVDVVVVCNQLGFGRNGSVPFVYGYYSVYESQIQFSMYEVECIGNESVITDCTHVTSAQGSCFGNPAMVVCNGFCKNGDVRLVDRFSSNQGLVEVCVDGEWAKVCTDMWDYVDAGVVCKHLGYSAGGDVLFRVPSSISSVVITGVECTQSTSVFGDCLHSVAQQCEGCGCTFAGVFCYVSQCSQLERPALFGTISYTVDAQRPSNYPNDILYTATFECDTSYVLREAGDAQQCTMQGWESGFDFVHCFRVSCSLVGNIANGHVQYSVNSIFTVEQPEGAEAIYTCNQGYTLPEGKRFWIRTCTISDDGLPVWIGSVPNCTESVNDDHLEYFTSYNYSYSGLDDGYVGEPIRIPTGLPFGDVVHYTAYVGANGLISFSHPYNFYHHNSFPSSNSFIVAPFANDLDITINSSVSVGVFNIYNTPATSEKYKTLKRVSRFIETYIGDSFNGYWMLFVTWNATKMYPRSSYIEELLSDNDKEILDKENTFQAVVITDYRRSYAIFTYQCGDLNSPGFAYFSTVGVFAGNSFNFIHTLSGTEDVIGIACSNSTWTNLVFKLDVEGTARHLQNQELKSECWWYYSFDLETELLHSSHLSQRLATIPTCPCSDKQIKDSVQFIPDPNRELYTNCYVSRFTDMSGLARYCCYENGHLYIPSGRPPVSYFLYDSNRQIENEYIFHLACCNIGMCELFYSRRTLNYEWSCESPDEYTYPTRAWTVSGHHIRTFDGAVYTFNGNGLYYVIASRGFQLQCYMTEIAYPNGVSAVSGFSACALTYSQSNILIMVELSSQEAAGGFTVTVNSDAMQIPVTDRLYISYKVEVTRTLDEVTVIIANGPYLRFTLESMSQQYFDIEVSALREHFRSPNKLTHFPRDRAGGLFGNFNSLLSDEFFDVDGIPLQDPTENQIIDSSEDWEVPAMLSLSFTSPPPDNHGFSPLHLSDIPIHINLLPPEVCNNRTNTLCVYEALATGNSLAAEYFLSRFKNLSAPEIIENIGLQFIPSYTGIFEINTQIRSCFGMIVSFDEEPPASMMLEMEVGSHGHFDETVTLSHTQFGSFIYSLLCVDYNTTGYIPFDAEVFIFNYNDTNGHNILYTPVVYVCLCENGYCPYPPEVDFSLYSQVNSNTASNAVSLDCVCDSLPNDNILFSFGCDQGDAVLDITDDVSSRVIDLSAYGFPFYGNTETVAYVNINGAIHFRAPSSYCSPADFPYSTDPLIAAFWHDINIQYGGSVFYRLSTDLSTIQLASAYLRFLYDDQDPDSPFGINFSPTFVLISTWDRVHPQATPAEDNRRNTFQVALISDGSVSYVLLLYHQVQWGPSVLIGFQSETSKDNSTNLIFRHPFSGTEKTRNIAHFSNVGSRGVFVYRVDGGTISEPTQLEPREPHRAYTGHSCNEDLNGCDFAACHNNGTCTDVPTPGAGIICPVCPQGFAQTGQKCYDISSNNDLCEAESDGVWGLPYPVTVPGQTVSQACPQIGTGTTSGIALRICMSGGVWGPVDTSNCTRQEFTEVQNMANEVFLMDVADIEQEDVEEILEELATATNTSSTGGTSNFASDLETTNNIVSSSVNYLLESVQVANETVALNFSEQVLNVLNNVLDESNSEGWEDLQEDSAAMGSEQVLLNAEIYGQYVSTSLSSDSVDTGNKTEIVLVRDNIVLAAQEVDPINLDDIIFPETVEFNGKSGSAMTIIPAALLQERGALEGNVSAVNILFSNLEDFLPMDNLQSNFTRPVTQVLSTQILSDLVKSSADFEKVARFTFVTRQFSEDQVAENPRCAFWKFSEDSKVPSMWSTEGVKTTGVTEDMERGVFEVHCESSHFTAFAVLMDVRGALNETTEEIRFALSVVTYVGCSISIFFLLVTIVYLLTLWREMLQKVHFFIHLNLAVALLLGYVVFLAGIQTAVVNRGLCVFVAALLHYLFTAVFFWMMCEGIMLYFMLVIVFAEVAKKWWIFFILGWVVPVVPVAISVGVINDQYGTKDYCWIAVGDYTKGAIWAFVVPMLVVILVNIFFLLAALRSVYIQRKSRMEEKGMKKNVKLFSQLFKATIILLPLLGLTWVFGLLSLNRDTIVFAWLFTIFNSLQGLFIFFFHVLRSEKVWNYIKHCGRKEGVTDSSVLGKNTSSAHSHRLSTSHGTSLKGQNSRASVQEQETIFENAPEDHAHPVLDDVIDSTEPIMVDESMFELKESESEEQSYGGDSDDNNDKWRHTVTFNWMRAAASHESLDEVKLITD